MISDGPGGEKDKVFMSGLRKVYERLSQSRICIAVHLHHFGCTSNSFSFVNGDYDQWNPLGSGKGRT